MLDAQLHLKPLHQQTRPTLNYERVTAWLDEIAPDRDMDVAEWTALGRKLHKWWEVFR